MDDHLTINGIEYIRKNLRDGPPERGTIWNGYGGQFMVVEIMSEERPGFNYGICCIKGVSIGRVWQGIVWSRFYEEHTQEG